LPAFSRWKPLPLDVSLCLSVGAPAFMRGRSASALRKIRAPISGFSRGRTL
jgi:hypothetical protein